MISFRSFAAATALALSMPTAIAQTGDEAPTEESVVLIADNLVENEADNSIVAEGNVEASYQGRTLRADKVIYNRDTNKVRAIGNVVILDPDGTQRFAEEVEVSSNLSDGYAVGFAVRMPQGGRAVASSAVRQEGGVNSLDQIVYTACEICDADDTPTWALRARRAVLNEESQMISYRDAVLEVGGVPVFYLPYFAHPDPSSDRRSGFLFPDLGLSTTVGAFYQQPYYWAISPSQELTIAPAVYERVNPLLELDYSKRFWSGQLNINTSFTYESLFDGDGERLADSEDSLRSHIFADGLFSLSREWAWGFGAERASDDLYLNRYDIDGEDDQRGLYVGQPRRLLSQVFLVGQDENFYSETSFLALQGLRAGDENAEFPIVTPIAYSERLFDLGAYGLASVEASAAVLNRDTGADSRRVSLGVDWSRRTILPGGIVAEPFLDVRTDYYDLDEEVSGQDNETRTLGSVGARISYPFIRRGENVDILVEPLIMGAWGVSDANDTSIPIEDSLLYEADYTTLFEPNGVGNYDLYEGDGRLTAGISTRARWRNGVELTAVAGRRWRSEEDPAFDRFSNLEGTSSDWVAFSSLDLGRPFRLETNLRFDQDDFQVNRVDARLTADIWRVRGGVQYFQINEDITRSGQREEGVALDALFELTDNVSLVYSRLRDIEDGFDTREGVGLRYTDGCSLFEIVYQRSDQRDRELGPNESIRFRFSLLTLGEFGSQNVD